MCDPITAFKCKTLTKVDSILDELKIEGVRNKTLDMVMTDLLDRLNNLEGFEGVADTVKRIIDLPGYKLVKKSQNPCYETHPDELRNYKYRDKC